MPDGFALATAPLERWFADNGWKAFDFQREVWNAWPAKLSRPAMFGRVAADSGPSAVISRHALACSPFSSVMVQRSLLSSKRAATTRLPKRMSRRRSNLSAT